MTGDEHREWADLMAAAQSGDGRSYVRLLQEIVPLFRRAARGLWPMAQANDIEDAVQETLNALHSVRHTYDPARPFLPWALAILRHRVIDLTRRRIRIDGREVGVDSLDETFPSLGTNTQSEYRSDAATLKRAIAALPPRQRTAVELLKLKELSLKEASAVSGMSRTALKVATHRAIKSLRVTLGGSK